MFAIYFASLVLDDRLEHPSSTRDAALETHFGTLYRTSFTLFKVITGGVDWGEMAALFNENNRVAGEVMLCGYVAFTVIAVMNVITGVFLETATERAKQER